MLLRPIILIVVKIMKTSRTRKYNIALKIMIVWFKTKHLSKI